MISREVVAIAIEAMSIIESEGIGLRPAVEKAALQLQVKEISLAREARRLAFETVNCQNILDFVLEKVLAPTEMDDLKLGVQAFLRLFIYATKLSPSSIKPAFFADLGRRILGWKELMPIELVLGRISVANIDDFKLGFYDDERLAFNSFYPLWFVKYVIRNFGRKTALTMLFFYNHKARTFIRLNMLKKNELEILKELKTEGILVESLQGFPYVFEVLDAKKSLRKWILSGQLHLQDLPSSLASKASNPCFGKNVLFVGASPTAPVTYLAQLMSNQGKISVIDNSESRLSKIEKDASANNISIIKTELVKDYDVSYVTQMDTVMIHAPSSRTGVFWRDPSLKWRTQPNYIEYFSIVQEKLLDIYSKAVCTGGNLVYWTRSITLEEDELAVENFLGRHPEFILVEAIPKTGAPGLRGQSLCQRFFPHLHFCDGAYIACMKKIVNSE